tara:strand:+ start:790 stop:1059 length:270 start_codon:yes stop_codon:yes gene_type:complete
MILTQSFSDMSQIIQNFKRKSISHPKISMFWLTYLRSRINKNMQKEAAAKMLHDAHAAIKAIEGGAPDISAENIITLRCVFYNQHMDNT